MHAQGHSLGNGVCMSIGELCTSMPECSDVRIVLVTTYIKHHAGGDTYA